MTETATATGIKLDVACGQNRQDGFHGIDIVQGLYDDDEYTVHDLTRFPWPFEESSVDEVFVSHYVEHTPHARDGQIDGLLAFMNELYRILVPGGKARIIHPYGRSNRGLQDPTHTRYIVEETWHYFSRQWREEQKLDHYPIVGDWELVNVGAAVMDQWTSRAQQAQMFAAGHYWNVVGDLSIDLRAIKEG